MDRLTPEEEAYLHAVLSTDRKEKQSIIQNVNAGRIKLASLTTGRLMNDVEVIDSIATKLGIQLKQ